MEAHLILQEWMKVPQLKVRNQFLGSYFTSTYTLTSTCLISWTCKGRKTFLEQFEFKFSYGSTDRLVLKVVFFLSQHSKHKLIVALSFSGFFLKL